MKTKPVDQFTAARRAKMDPTYHLVLDIDGYRLGATGKVRWDIEALAWSENMDPANALELANVLELVVEALRAPDE